MARTRQKKIRSPFRKFNISVGNAFLGGGWSIASPASWHYNGSNYYLLYERYDETEPSKIWIVKQTDNNIEVAAINSGTSNPDNQDHTTPIWGGVDPSGYLYVKQCDGWVQPMRVYKSNSPENIHGWTQVGTFDTDASYIWTIEGTDVTDMWYVTRSGNAANNGYDLSLLNVDLTTPSGYTKLRITEGNFNTNQVRHYAQCARFFGTSDYRVLFVNHRNESNSVNYKASILLWEVGTNNIHDFAQTTSKDVGTNGGVTNTELEDDFILVGTDSTKTVTNLLLPPVQINNDVYIVTSEPAGTYIRKYAIGSLTPTASYTLPWWPYFSLTNTGSNLLIHGRSNTDLMRIYSIDYDLTGFTLKKDITGMIPSGNDWGFPYNYGDIVGKHLILGAAEPGDDGNIPIILTNQNLAA